MMSLGRNNEIMPIQCTNYEVRIPLARFLLQFYLVCVGFDTYRASPFWAKLMPQTTIDSLEQLRGSARLLRGTHEDSLLRRLLVAEVVDCFVSTH